jgi:hypothetical protein
MPPRPARRQLGLFDNPVRDFTLDEFTETLRALERERPGRTADELSRAVFSKLAVRRTRRAAELVAEAIRLARTGSPAPRSPARGGRPAPGRSGTGRSAQASSPAPMAASPSRRSRHTTRPIPNARTDRELARSLDPERYRENCVGFTHGFVSRPERR